MKKLMLFAAIFILWHISAISQGTWTSKAAFGGVARIEPFSFSINGIGYVGGGEGSVSHLFDTWAYDPALNIWTQKANYPAIAAHFYTVGFDVNSKGYVTCGSFHDTFSTQSNELWEYDPVANSWLQKTSFPGAPRSKPSSFTIGNKAYVGFGFQPLTTYFNDLYEYDPASDAWTQKANLPSQGRMAPMTFVINGIGYITSGHGVAPIRDLWQYTPATNSWAQKQSPPDTIYGGSGAASGGFGYVIGGYKDINPVNYVFKYDPISNVWTNDTGMPSVKALSGEFVIQNIIYMTLGATSIFQIGTVLTTFAFNPNNPTSSIEEPEYSFHLLFPTIGSGEFSFSKSGLISPNEESISIFNLTGSLVKLIPFEYKINLNDLVEGIYLVRLNKSQQVYRIVIKK